MNETPNCRFCGTNKWVAIWHDDAPEQTICMECCGSKEHDRGDGEWGHEFDRGTWISVSSCIHCGMERDYDANPTDGPVM